MKNVFKTFASLIAALAFSLVSISFVAAANFPLSGRVTNQSGGPLPGSTVEVINPSNSMTVASATTDSTGYYTVSVLGGTYNVKVTPPTGSGFGAAIALNQNITSDTNLDFVLVPPGSVSLSGRVLDGLGNGLPNQYVNMYPAGGTPLPTVLTDASGNYSFQVGAGDYYLYVYGYNSDPANAPHYYYLQSTSPVSLAQTTVMDIQLPARKVSVHVQDPGANSVANVAMSTQGIYNPNLMLGSTPAYGYSYYFTGSPTYTDSSGNATMWLFPSVPGGTYTLTAAPPSGGAFATFNVQNVNVTSDKSIVIALQFVHDPPVTTATLSPSPDGSGTYCGTTTVSLSATAFSGFTVAATHYTVDGGPTQTYTSPFAVSGGGPHSISYWSVDNVGVFEITNTRSFINSNPVVTITGPASGSIYAVNTPVNFTGTFTDAGGGTHTAQWTFDGSSQAGTINESTGAVSAAHTFTTPGVYMVGLAVTDSCGGTGTASTVGGLDALVVIYDPDGGFVTGGGWINSPAGAYVPSPTLTGKANFGFVSKYQHGANVPTGQTEFQFRVANFSFHSTAYDWLVVAGARAQYKGTGTVNGSGNYAFILTAIDGQINGGGGVDKFRIKIWDKANGAMIYDNQLGAADGADPSTVLGGGSIVIHN